MGREKRLSEAKTRDLTEKTARPVQSAHAAAVATHDFPSMPVVAAPGRGLTVPQIILQLVLLYLLPITLIVLFGKLVLGL